MRAQTPSRSRPLSNGAMQWRFISAPMLLGLCLLLDCPSPSASTWATSWGPTVLNYNTWGMQTVVDTRGNSYMTGYFGDTVFFGDYNLTSVGETDIFVLKADPTGNVSWAVSWGNTSTDSGVGIGVDDAGSVVYVTGKFKYSITVGGIYISGSNYVGQTGMLVAKLNASNGAVLWADGWGGKADTAGHLVAVPRSGDCAYAVIYTTRTTLSIGSYSFTCTNQWGGDVIIAKYNASGGVEWAKKYGTDDIGLWVYSVAADSSGVYVSGLIADDGVWFDNFTTSGSISSTAKNTLVFKVSAQGSVVYVKNWNAAESWVEELVVDDDGNLYGNGLGNPDLASSVGTMGSSSFVGLGGVDAIAFRLDATGGVDWAFNYGSKQNDYGLGIGYDRTNKAVYITGYTTDYFKVGNFYIQEQGHAQVYVVRLNASSGNATAVWLYGSGPNNEEGVSVGVDGKGLVYVGGVFDTTDGFYIEGHKLATKGGGSTWNAFLARITDPPVAPTSAPTQAPTRAPTQAPTRSPYPSVKSLSAVAATSSSLTVTLTASKKGYAWCLAVPSSSGRTPSGATVKATAQGYSAISGEDVSTNVTMAGLVALTNYTAYCYTEDTSTPANKLGDTAVAAARVKSRTPCCYPLSTPAMPTALYSGSVSAPLALISPVTADVTVTVGYALYKPSASASSCNTTTFAAAPSSAWNTSKSLLAISPSASLSLSSSATRSFTLAPAAAGCYRITYNVTGPSSGLFASPSSSALFVLVSSQPPPAPSLASARFSDSGAQVFVAFDSDTDQARIKGSFACSRLFGFAKAYEATCVWANSTTAVATLPSSASLKPGDGLNVTAGMVRPRCPPSSSNATRCLSWPTASLSTVTVARPSTALLPSPSLVFASTISPCQDLVVDGSASSGSGGRRMWFTWTVTSPSGADTSNITAYLKTINGNATASSSSRYGPLRLSLPRAYLTAPATYRVVLTLHNFLGYSADSSSAVVSVVSTNIPTVRITGPAYRTTLRTAALALFAQASIPACSAAKTLAYRWTIQGPGASSLSSSSVDPRFFRLAANRLTTGGTYNVSVRVTDSLGLSANASAQVYVSRSPLVAAIRGGDRTVGQSSSLVLDGSDSVDPDSSATTLTYNWTCTRGGALYGRPCLLPASFNASHTPTVTLAAGSLPSSGLYLFGLTASDPVTARTSAASVAITVKSDAVPLVLVSSSLPRRFNPSSKLAITATVSASSGGSSSNFTATWALTTGSLSGGSSLSSWARTALTRTSAEAPLLSSLSVPLVLAAGALSPKAWYQLTLSATNAQGVSGASVVSFWTTGPPTSGYLDVSPTTGTALVDPFTLSSLSWTDDADALPLTYAFAYLAGSEDDGSAEYQLTYGQTSPLFSPVYLPRGQGENSTLLAVAYVTNTHDASARATATITVSDLQRPISEVSANVSSRLSGALQAFDTDTVLAVAGAAAPLLDHSGSAAEGLRADILVAVVNASVLQDVSLPSVQQQATVLNRLLPSAQNLTGQAVSAAVGLVGSMTSSSEAIGLTPSTAAALTASLSTLLSLTANGSKEHSGGAMASSLSSSASLLAMAGTVQLTPGEQPFTASAPNLNITAHLSEPQETPGKLLAPPGTGSSLQLPPQGLSSFYDTTALSAVAMGAVGLPASLRQDKKKPVVSPAVLRLSIRGVTNGRGRSRRLSELHGRRLTSSGDGSALTLTLATSHQNYTSWTEQVVISCAEGERRRTKTRSCRDTGEVFTLQCSGRAEQRAFTCGARTSSLCSIWDGSQWSSASCEVTEITPTQVTCSCGDLAALLVVPGNGTDGRRRLSSAGGEGPSEEEEERRPGVAGWVARQLKSRRRSRSRVMDDPAGEAGGDFGAVLALIGGSTAETLKEAGRLNASVVAKNAVVFVTMGLFLLLTLLLGGWAYRKDKADACKEEEEAEQEGGEVASGESTEEVEEESRVRRLMRESLPAFARVREYWQLVAAVLKDKHDWASIALVYDEAQPRLVRVILLATAILTVMFVNAVLNAQLNPDPTLCDGFSDETGCLSKKLAVDPLKTHCLWDQEAQSCSYNEEAAGSLWSVVVVALLSAMLSVPPVMAIDSLASHVLCAPIAGKGEDGEAVADASTSNADSSRAGEGLASPRSPRLSQRLVVQATSARDSLRSALTARQRAKAEKKRRAREMESQVQAEVAKAVKVIGLQRQQLLRAIEVLEAELQETKQQQQEQQQQQPGRLFGAAVASEEKRLRQLKAFRTKFERKWGLAPDGTFIQGSGCFGWLLPRPSLHASLEKRIRHELLTANKLEEELSELDGDARELQLLEYSRLDFLGPVERRVYLKNKIEVGEGDEVKPVSAAVFYAGWSLVVAYSLGLAFYICLFGVENGASVTNAWLVAFVVGLVQDVLVYGPCIILFFEAFLPLFVRHKIKEELDAARTDPIVFADQMPPGPATRVALRHPDWTASRIIAATHTPRHQAPPSPAGAGPSPTAGASPPASPRMVSGVKASVYSPRAVRDMRAFGQEAEAYLFREVRARNRWAVRVVAAPLLALFLTLPDSVQELLVEQAVPVITGGLLLGFDVLYRLSSSAIAGPLLFLVLLLLGLALYCSPSLRQRARRAFCCDDGPGRGQTQAVVAAREEAGPRDGQDTDRHHRNNNDPQQHGAQVSSSAGLPVLTLPPHLFKPEEPTAKTVTTQE